jgi:hypothetical protein
MSGLAQRIAVVVSCPAAVGGASLVFPMLDSPQLADTPGPCFKSPARESSSFSCSSKQSINQSINQASKHPYMQACNWPLLTTGTP